MVVTTLFGLWRRATGQAGVVEASPSPDCLPHASSSHPADVSSQVLAPHTSPPATSQCSSGGPEQAPLSGASTESWRGEGAHIAVKEHPGQLLQVKGTARVPLAPGELFRIITHPSSEQIFRHLDKCDSRVVLQDGGPNGVTVVESEHLATWQCLGFSGKLRTRLRVEQRPEEGHVHFVLLPSRSRLQLMRHFSGSWKVEGAEGHAAPAGQEASQHAMLTLEQVAQPAVSLPPPLGSLFRSIARRQLQGIFEDIQAEAQRVRQGQPTLW